MKRTIKVKNNKNETVEKQITYIPMRYIIAIMLTIFEIIAIIGVLLVCILYIPYFYIAVIITEIVVILSLISRNDNPDYKIPWLIVVLVIPVVGFMLYFLFYNRKLNKKYINKVYDLKNRNNKLLSESFSNETIKSKAFDNIKKDELAYSNAIQLCKISESNLYQNTNLYYFESGEKAFIEMLKDLKNAKKYIFIEYFIIEEGLFWNSILNILIEKAKNGIEVKVIWDDIGCMNTLPGNYFKELEKYNIKALCYSRLKGQADSEFNNRNHRKIMIIDGNIGYTGGINIADEYINHREKFGYWKDVAIRLEGEAVNGLTKLFIFDYSINMKNKKDNFRNDLNDYFIYKKDICNDGFVIPFGDGPKPMYKYNVGKTVIMNMLNQAKKYVYIMTPYLIIDNELCQTIENTALRGIDVRIVVPHIPDKKMVFTMTKSYYKRLKDSGVKIYEFTSGFVHAKVYLSDNDVAMVGTINLDYRSLVHHFENGIWIYKHKEIENIKEDIINTINNSEEIVSVKNSLLNRLIVVLVKIFSPLL